MTMDFSAERLSYEKGELLESQLPNSPKDLVEQWLQQAIEQKLSEPYAMSLATCGSDLRPNVRTVLLREMQSLQGLGEQNADFGLVFYTNYDSQKGGDLAQNPHAQVLFFWHALERQIRVSGKIELLSEEKSTAYFHKRPHDSQIAAWVSAPQSGVVESRKVMDDKFAQLIAQYPQGMAVPKPDFWGGYVLIAQQVEFWQGRANRMHDRIRYEKVGENWTMSRLLP